MKQPDAKQHLSARSSNPIYTERAGAAQAPFQQETGQIEGFSDQEDVIGTGRDFVRL